MLSQLTIERILCAALLYAGDFAEIYIESTRSNSLSAINRRIENVSSGIDFGVGIRVMDGVRSVYVYANSTDENVLIKMAKDASASLHSNKCSVAVPLSAIRQYSTSAPVFLPDSRPDALKADLLRQACDIASQYDARITQTGAGYSDLSRDIIIANSEGLYVSDHRVRTRFSVEAVATKGNEKQTGRHSPGAGKGLEFIDEMDLNFLATDAARMAVTMIEAKPCPSGRYPVVIGNAFGGVIFHEACGHALEATSVGIDASVFAGKVGEKIASDCVTAVDDPTMLYEWGSYSIDDEGVEPIANTLIDNGILKSYMIDRLGSRRMNMASTGSGRRQNYRYCPTSRMSNTFIAAGKETPEQIISDTEYGIYASSMGGGSVDPATGEFNFSVNEAYLIQGGKVTIPLRGATLIGKGDDVLMTIDRVADDLKLAQGVCGSISGHVPASIGQPTIRVSQMTVGGVDA
ncbi:MAG: TldD/PmbA family protein [Clostridiaceae bacterium]|nr:TldD/PmbA family protein [Clostridiaceae bacterium]